MARRPRNSEPRKEDDRAASPDDRIIEEAKSRFKRAMAWENDFRKLYIEDVRFANGDSDNGWQWPLDLKRDRDLSRRPSLTINKTQVIVLDVVNEGKKNPPSITIKPTGDEGTFEAAECWEGLIRNIEYESMAQVIYSDAQRSQVEGGIGFWRVTTYHVDDRSFDQAIRLDPIADQLSVLLDCDIKQRDGSDANWGFIYDAVNREEFEREHPDIDLPPASATFALTETDGWITDDEVRVAEYYRLRPIDDELIYLEPPGSQPATFLRSEVPQRFRKLLAMAEADRSNNFRTRKVRRKRLEWFKIAGDEIIDRRLDLKGQYIPIVRVPGRETSIDNKLERKGLVRTLKDPQRMYNYNSSGQVEFGALQTKTPWIVPAAAIEGNQDAWNNANVQNKAYLTYKHRDEAGPIPPPQRIEPPGASSAFIEGLRIAAAEIEMASGQYRPQQENPMLERTPKAIDARERLAETAVFDFVFNQSLAVRHTARIIIDLAPHIYDTERVIKILGKDGKQRDVRINPTMEAPYQGPGGGEDAKEEVAAIFNPKVGKYSVQADIGPAFGTQRQQAWNALSQIVGSNGELLNIIGDLVFASADFHMSDKLAERFKRQIKANAPYLLDDGAPTPQMQAMQAELQKQQQYVGELLQKLAEMKLELKSKDELRDIDVYESQTRRLTAQGNVIEDFSKLDPRIQKKLQETVMATLRDMGFDLTDVIQANKPGLDASEDGAADHDFGGIATEAPGGVAPTSASTGERGRGARE